MLKYKDYKLIQPNQNQIGRINELIKNENGSIFHDVELNRIVESNFKTQLFYFVDKPNNITCFSPVHITKNKYGLNRYHFKPLYDVPYAGFIGNDEIDLDKISVGFFESFKYEGFPYYEEGSKLKENVRIGETAMIDLFSSEDDIYNQSIHSKRRNMIRKAVREGIKVRKYSDLEGLFEFYKILEPLHIKLGFNKNMNIDYYKEIFNSYKNKNKAFILLAFKEKKLLSGVFILGNGNYMHYYKGASLFGVKNEGQGELLQWEAIKISKLLGAKKYDLCNLDREKLPHIYRFKTGISNSIYRYPKFIKNKLGFRIISRLNNA